MLSCAVNHCLTFPVRHATDFVPIFFSDIIIDFYCARVETVAALQGGFLAGSVALATDWKRVSE
jgi:hypothetical protein